MSQTQHSRQIGRIHGRVGRVVFVATYGGLTGPGGERSYADGRVSEAGDLALGAAVSGVFVWRRAVRVGCYVRRFFARVAACVDAVVIDHFMQGDGSADGARTRRTPLPAATWPEPGALRTIAEEHCLVSDRAGTGRRAYIECRLVRAFHGRDIKSIERMASCQATDVSAETWRYPAPRAPQLGRKSATPVGARPPSSGSPAATCCGDAVLGVARPRTPPSRWGGPVPLIRTPSTGGARSAYGGARA